MLLLINTDLNVQINNSLFKGGNFRIKNENETLFVKYSFGKSIKIKSATDFDAGCPPFFATSDVNAQ